MSELRDALEDIRTEVNCATFAPEEYDLFGTLRLIGQKATDALEAPSEMQQLRRDVVQARDGCIEESGRSMEGWDMGYVAAMRYVLDLIGGFGYGEEK